MLRVLVMKYEITEWKRPGQACAAVGRQLGGDATAATTRDDAPSVTGRVFEPDPTRHRHYEELFRRVYKPLLESATAISSDLRAISQEISSSP
jgi:sugar (pentulose or hexulose) kinase